MGKFIDLTGQCFGRIEVLSRAPDKLYTNGRRKVFWNCQCSCGNLKIIAGDNLKRGGTLSCGCYNKEVLSNTRTCPYKTKYPKEYNSYRAMKDRVSNNANYQELNHYVEESWPTFESFLKDLGPIPEEGYTLDRINSYEGYKKGNVRWASKSMQAYNGKLPLNNSTGVVGVSPWKGKFQASIGVQGRSIYLGIFDTIAEAAQAREEAENKYYQESPKKRPF